MNIDVRAAVILLCTLFLGAGLGAVGEGALVNARNVREQDLRQPPGFVAHMEAVIGPHDTAQASAVRPYLEQTARQNDSVMRVAQAALRAGLDSMRLRLNPLLDADQRDRLDREAAAPRRSDPGVGVQADAADLADRAGVLEAGAADQGDAMGHHPKDRRLAGEGSRRRTRRLLLGGGRPRHLRPFREDRVHGMSAFTPTERTKVRRKPDRGSYDRELIYRILDQAFVCAIGFVVDGMPFVVPTNYVRVGDRLFLHGSTASRLMRVLASGAPVCLSVTLLDGIVFSPTATGHSVNYRSVVVMGTAEVIESAEAKLAAMRDFVEYVSRGRWAAVRPPTVQELKGTMVVALPLVEASAKVRTGFAVDDDDAYAGSAWTGVLPFTWTPGTPVRDPRGNPDAPTPANISHYVRPQ